MARDRPGKEPAADDPAPGQGTWFDRLPLVVALLGTAALVALVLIVVTVDLPEDPGAAAVDRQADRACMPTHEVGQWYNEHPDAEVLAGEETEDGRVCLTYLAGPGNG